MTNNSLSPWYVLDFDNNPVQTNRSFFKIFMKYSEQRIVGKHQMQIDGVKVIISTVFTGLNDNDTFFQSMVLGGEFSESNWYYNTYEQALGGHNQIVAAYEQEYNVRAIPCE